jgi:Tfp pilus assembly ATPase PilU
MRYDRTHMTRLLRQMRDSDAGELLLKVPGRPAMRVDGDLVRLAEDPVMPVDTQSAARSLMALGDTEIALGMVQDAEFAFGMQGVGRFRVQIFRQRGSLGVSVRRMANLAPSLFSVGLATAQAQEALRSGLCLAAGSRSQELIGALVDHLNTTSSGHVIVLEDQLEYLHKDRRAAITQREVGLDTQDWPSAVRSALRQRPDALVVGELYDQDVAERLLRAAEQGQCVVLGMPGVTPKQAITNFVRRFDPRREREIALRVRTVLRAAVVLNDQGCEVLLADRPAAAAAI